MSTPADVRRIVVLAVVVTLAGVVGLWLAFLLRRVLLLVYVSGLLAIGISPAVRWLQRLAAGRRVPRWLAITVIYVGLIAGLAALLLIVVPPLVAQASDLWRRLPGYLDRAQDALIGLGLIAHTYTWSELLQQVPNPAGALTGLLGILGVVQGAIGVIGAFVTILVLPFYLLLEGPALQAGFVRLFARQHRPMLARVTHNVALKISAWLGGQLLLAFVIGGSAALGLWLLGVPYFYVLAALAGVGELIPVVGPILAAIPAVLVALTVSTETGVLTLAYFAVQQFVENHFLVPRIMERQVGVSAVAVIVSLLAGSELLGMVGALLAVPTVAILNVLAGEFLERAENPPPAPPAGPAGAPDP